MTNKYETDIGYILYWFLFPIINYLSWFNSVVSSLFVVTFAFYPKVQKEHFWFLFYNDIIEQTTVYYCIYEIVLQFFRMKKYSCKLLILEHESLAFNYAACMKEIKFRFLNLLWNNNDQ